VGALTEGSICTKMSMIKVICFLLVMVSCFGQFDPEDAHVNLYFPHLAVGGTAADRWQTSFVFVNPHPSLTARVFLSIHGDDGQPLSLDLGGGGASFQSVTIPPSGSRTLSSSSSFPTTVTGYAVAGSNLPLQATVLFRRTLNGVPQVEVSAPATLPSPRYTSPATHDLGIAMVNIYNVSKSFQISALDSNGRPAGTSIVNLGPQEHLSFNLFQRIPTLPADFSGSVQIVPSGQITDQFLAWTLNSDRGLVASLPPGRLSWPISHEDRIALVYNKLLAAAPAVLAGMGVTNVSLDALGVLSLVTSPEQIINTFARPGTIQVDLSLSELISDSPSELAFLVGHELGHEAKLQHGASLILSDAELDADLFSLLLMVNAGFDPYGSAGALGKLIMASHAGLVAATFDDLADPASSFKSRIDLMLSTLSNACGQPAGTGLCGAYKAFVHPHFSAAAPF
jgi:hypothetical protein